MLGLDAAGKTTILYRMKLGETTVTIPTIGFNVETIQYKKTEFTIWDVGGQGRIRPLWRHYTTNTDCLIFVIDATDNERIQEATEELQALMADDGLDNAAILIYSNKMDLPGAIDAKTLAKTLGLDKERKRRWNIQPAVATKGEGLVEGLEWMNQAIKDMKKGAGK